MQRVFSSFGFFALPFHATCALAEFQKMHSLCCKCAQHDLGKNSLRELCYIIPGIKGPTSRMRQREVHNTFSVHGANVIVMQPHPTPIPTSPEIQLPSSVFTSKEAFFGLMALKQWIANITFMVYFGKSPLN